MVTLSKGFQFQFGSRELYFHFYFVSSYQSSMHSLAKCLFQPWILLNCVPEQRYQRIREWMQMDSNRTIRSSKRNKRHPRIIAMASIHSAQLRILIFANDAHWVISRAVCVLRLITMADSRTERLCILLPASIKPSCITHMYLIHL